MVFVLLRLALLLAAAFTTAAMVAAATGNRLALTATAHWSALYFIPVNVLCLWLLRRWAHRQGGSLRALAGFERGRLGRDALQGLLWMVVLYVPFALAVGLAMLLMFGPGGMLGAFERVFAPDAGAVTGPTGWLAVALAALVAVLFPVTNAPTEELYYRGHAQGELLAAGRPAWYALLVPSLAFGAQHVLLAPNAAGRFAYFLAFTAWGLGAGLIYLRRGRLMPVIVAHLLTNAFTALIPLLVILAGAA